MTSGTASLFSRGAPVPAPGTVEAVASSQRTRMLDAVTRAVAAQGFPKTTVADIVSIAGVSRSTFYDQFHDREACFLVAYETGAQIVLDEIAAEVRGLTDPGWRVRLRVSLEAYTHILAAEPDFAKALLVDVLGAGPAAVSTRRVVFARFVDHYRALRAVAALEEPAIGTLPDLYLRALVGGIDELAQEHIVVHGATTLPRLAPDLVTIANAVFSAPVAAAVR